MLDETVSQINFKEILDFTKMDQFVENLFSNWKTNKELHFVQKEIETKKTKK